MHPSGEDSSELGRLVDAGAVKVILDSVYPFERIDEAMAKLESGRAKGKIVVTMPDSQAGRGLDGRPAVASGTCLQTFDEQRGRRPEKRPPRPAAKDRTATGRTRTKQPVNERRYSRSDITRDRQPSPGETYGNS
jgi:Zinc-binding dehydrogenase